MLRGFRLFRRNALFLNRFTIVDSCVRNEDQHSFRRFIISATHARDFPFYLRLYVKKNFFFLINP